MLRSTVIQLTTYRCFGNVMVHLLLSSDKVASQKRVSEGTSSDGAQSFKRNKLLMAESINDWTADHYKESNTKLRKYTAVDCFHEDRVLKSTQ